MLGCSVPLCCAACADGASHVLECQLFQSKHVTVTMADIKWKVFNAAIFPLRMWLHHRLTKCSTCAVLLVCVIVLLVLGWCVSYFFLCWAGGVCHISSFVGLVVCVIFLLVFGWWCVS